MTTRISKPQIVDVNVVKIAVQHEGKIAQLIVFDQKQSLAAIIHDLSNSWELTNPEQYALQFADNSQNYITEKNRQEVKNGSVLGLILSPSKSAEVILEKMSQTAVEDKLTALKHLSKSSPDITFASEFINKQGLSLLVSAIEGGKLTGEVLAYALLSFIDLMDHGIVSWDVLEPPFINKVVSYISSQAATQDPKTLQAALEILGSLVLNSSSGYNQVERETTLPSLANNLQNTMPQIQQHTVALINALLQKADDGKRKVMAKTLNTRQIRNFMVSNIIQSAEPMGSEMAHELYVLQTLTLNLLENRKNTKMDPQDVDALDKIKELRRIAFDSDIDAGTKSDSTARRHGVPTKDYRKLGFKNDTNPALDFAETPPGLLALDNMSYFAQYHPEKFTKVVLENSCRADEYECPFGRTSIELTKLLCEILKIGEPPNEQGQSFHPMFFNSDHPFEEFFCICIILVNKTWREMRATVEDFVKVFNVVREQITRALSSSPTTLEAFKSKLAILTYTEITNLRQQERTNREEWESTAKPIVELKKQITPEMTELVQQQRLGFLVDGTRFQKYPLRSQRTKDKFWYIRLSPNHKVFHYGDCDEKTIPVFEDLPNKLPVIDIKALLVRKECPHMKEAKNKKSTAQLAFSLILDSNESGGSLDFVAPDEKIYDYWTDGINALLGSEMTSKEATSDLDILLGMEIKLRLLDVEGIDTPEEPPPIPPEPDNYDFCLV
nr:EOG090X02BW [Lepidurus arcticus]